MLDICLYINFIQLIPENYESCCNKIYSLEDVVSSSETEQLQQPINFTSSNTPPPFQSNIFLPSSYEPSDNSFNDTR